MATTRLERIDTVNLPLALFLYGFVTWVPIMVSALLMVGMGYRLVAGSGTSTNVFPIDFIGWGEALHHNHHHRPGRANLAIADFEFDPGFWTLWLLSKVGIVRDLRP